MMRALKGQRILLIAPRFFGYERDIQEELIRQGAMVDWLPDRPFDTPLMSALTKIQPNLILPAANRLYMQMLEKFAADHYNMIIVINGQTLSGQVLLSLRNTFPAAKFVLYMWDSIANRKRVQKNLEFFDKIFTFDPRDATNYKIILRPLFYGHKFDMIPTQDQTFKYKISFVGTSHSDRFKIIDQLRLGLPSNIECFWYLYLQAPWVLQYYRLTKPGMSHAKKNDFKFTPLDKMKLKSVFFDSLSILDIEHPLQIGLTMRTFETLGASKKLITTNSGIRDYDFFSSDNICVIDRHKPFVPASFFDIPYTPLSPQIRNRYSITGWLSELIS